MFTFSDALEFVENQGVLVMCVLSGVLVLVILSEKLIQKAIVKKYLNTMNSVLNESLDGRSYRTLKEILLSVLDKYEEKGKGYACIKQAYNYLDCTLIPDQRRALRILETYFEGKKVKEFHRALLNRIES